MAVGTAAACGAREAIRRKTTAATARPAAQTSIWQPLNKGDTAEQSAPGARLRPVTESQGARRKICWKICGSSWSFQYTVYLRFMREHPHEQSMPLRIGI